MKKKILIALLAVTMALAACGGSDEDVKGSVTEKEETSEKEKDNDADTDEEEDAQTAEEQTVDEEKEDAGTAGEEEVETSDSADAPKLSQGSMQGGTYTNTFLGIGCDFDSEWTIASEEELLEFSGLVMDQLEDAGFQKTLDTAGMIYDLYAYVNDGEQSVNIILQNANVLYQMTMSEADYVEANLGSVEDALKAMGYDTVTATASTATFAGKEHAVLIVEGHYGEDVTIYEKQVVIKEGDYMAAVTVASFYEDKTDELLNAFYEVQ